MSTKPIPILLHAERVPAGTVETALAAVEMPWEHVKLYEQPHPALDVEHLPGLIVMGGPMNVDQSAEFPFLVEELDWLRRAVAAGVPLLGICLGAQLLAKSQGAAVYHLPQMPSYRPEWPPKEIGWRSVELLAAAAEDPLLGPCYAEAGAAERTLTVFEWHGDTLDLPRGAVHLARGACCPHQAFRCGRRAWGVQFHFEMTAALIEHWLDNVDGNDADYGYVDATLIRAETRQHLDRLQSLARGLLSRFAHVVRQRNA